MEKKRERERERERERKKKRGEKNGRNRRYDVIFFYAYKYMLHVKYGYHCSIRRIR